MPLSIEHRDFGPAHASAEYAALGQAQLAQRYLRVRGEPHDALSPCASLT
jgi:hypothetical protein